MTIFRKNSGKGYTCISNDLLGHEGLSARAIGLACKILSKPDNWVIKMDYFVKTSKEGREAIRTAVHELAEHGFLMRERVRHESGKMETVTHIADYPKFIDIGTTESRINGYQPKTEQSDSRPIKSPTYQKPVSRKAGQSEKPSVLVSTDLLITEERSTEKETTDASDKHLHASSPSLQANEFEDKAKAYTESEQADSSLQADGSTDQPEAYTEGEGLSPYDDIPVEQLEQCAKSKTPRSSVQASSSKKSDADKIVEAYIEALGEWERNPVPTGETRKSAKGLVERGVTPDEVTWAVGILKTEDKFYKEKHLRLSAVANEIGAIVMREENRRKSFGFNMVKRLDLVDDYS